MIHLITLEVHDRQDFKQIGCTRCHKVLYLCDPTLPGLGPGTFMDALKSVAVNHRCNESRIG